MLLKNYYRLLSKGGKNRFCYGHNDDDDDDIEDDANECGWWI